MTDATAPSAGQHCAWAQALDELRGAGAARCDPVRFHYLEALARRVAAQAGPARHLLEQRLEARQDHAIDVVLRRGIDEGRLPADLDLDRAGSLLVGPLLLAQLMDKPALDDAFSTYVVDAFLRAHAL